jgi:ABC-type antimicrobial peptide transport system permease subunit
MIGSVIVNGQLLHIGTSFDPLTIGGLLLLGIVLSVAASALTALPASSEKPLAVLRYE